MHRIDTPTAQKDKFGQGKNGFTRGNPQTGTLATKMDSLYFDAIQEEIANAIESVGIVLNKEKHDQLKLAIQQYVKNGQIKLSSSTSSDSQTEAATPKAVKTVNDDVKKRVPSDRKINDKQLDVDITLSADDVKALPAKIKTNSGQPLLDENGKTAYEIGNCTDFKNGLKSKSNEVITTGNISSYLIGGNQKWVNVTENRKAGVVYTNTTGKTIVVCINVDFNADNGQLLIDDVLVATRLFDGTGARSFITFVVPHNSTYQINNSSAIWSWSELR